MEIFKSKIKRVVAGTLMIVLVVVSTPISTFAASVSGGDVQNGVNLEESSSDVERVAKEEEISSSSLENITAVSGNEVQVYALSHSVGGKCGDNLTWNIENGILTISGTGNMWDYKSLSNYHFNVTDAPWGEYRFDLVGLNLEEGITHIGSFAFASCANFSGNLNIPASVVSIGDSAFEECRGFEGTLYIPNNIISIGDSAFNDCNGFDGNLNISDSVISIGSSAFEGCNGFIGDLTIPNSVTSIGSSAFKECSGFSGNLNISNNVTHIQAHTFNGCNGLVGDLIIPDNIISVGDSAFEKCSGFDGKLHLSNNITHIGDYAFAKCSGLKGDLVIPNKIAIIGNGYSEYQHSGQYAFYGCSGLNGNLIIGESVGAIGGWTFDQCNFSDVYFKGDSFLNSYYSSGFEFIRDSMHNLYYPINREGWKKTIEVYNDFNWIPYNGENGGEQLFTNLWIFMEPDIKDIIYNTDTGYNVEQYNLNISVFIWI